MNTPTTRARRGAASAAIAVVVALLLSACLPEDSMDALEALNRDRTASGRRALVADRAATAKAQSWAEHLARIGRLEHSNLSSGMAGTGWCSIGENVGYAGTPKMVQETFMRSSAHRANLLNPQWTHVGVGSARSDGRVYIVQVFYRKGC